MSNNTPADNTSNINNIYETVRFRDSENGEEMPMHVVFKVEENNRTYALLAPTGQIVNLLEISSTDEEAGEMSEADSETMNRLKNKFNESLARFNVELRTTGSVWFLSNDLPDSAYEDLEIVYLHLEDMEDMDEEGEEGESKSCCCHGHCSDHDSKEGEDSDEDDYDDCDDTDSYYLLLNLEEGNKKYWLVSPISPPLYAVEMMKDGALRPLDDDEAERVAPAFEKVMESSKPEIPPED